MARLSSSAVRDEFLHARTIMYEDTLTNQVRFKVEFHGVLVAEFTLPRVYAELFHHKRLDDTLHGPLVDTIKESVYQHAIKRAALKALEG